MNDARLNNPVSVVLLQAKHLERMICAAKPDNLDGLWDCAKAIRDAAEAMMTRIGQIENGL